MAYPFTCAGALTQMQMHTVFMFSQADDAITDEQYAHTHWNLNQDHAAIEDILKALHHIVSSLKYGSFSYAPFYPYGALHYYLTTCLDEPEIDMDMILDAMVGATPEQVMYFIGLADAYRQSVWNKPFDKEFFAALARGFALWP